MLDYVADKPYGLGIWIQAILGLRVGELQALTWENVFLEEGKIRICRNYIRKEDTFRDYPKGRRHHTAHSGELLEKLKARDEQPEGHSSPRVTDRYLHNRRTRLDEISGQMRLFPKPAPPETPPMPAVSQCFRNDAQANVLLFRRR